MTDSPLHLLAGDIGGTKSNLALFTLVDGRLQMGRNRRITTSSHTGLNAIIREFLGPNFRPIQAASFGVPGPVKNGRVHPTNLSWGVDATEISREFSIPQVRLLNDLAANALGISEMAPDDFAILQKGSPGVKGNRCVVSPGTGLGEAGLYWDGRRHRVWASEGGHSDFGPRTEVEIALLQHLIKQYGHVSYERVASGMGIENIYRFLRDTQRGKTSAKIAKEIEGGDPGAVISQHASAGDCPMCVQTIEIFLSCLGAEAGNMALKSMAIGGVYLGGGIPGKMLSQFRSVAFTHAFNSKGRLTHLMESMPVKVILNDQTALIGAARHAVDCSLSDM